MSSFLLQITILALICSMALAGITLFAIDPRYDNNAISKENVCDHTAPTAFLQQNQASFNCSQYLQLQNGSFVCNDGPCQFEYIYGPRVECVWQTTRPPVFFQPGSSKYNLFPCYKCPTQDCNGRYYYDTIACTIRGKMITKDYGVTWTCSDETCKGEMKKQVDGTFNCVDNTCAGTMAYTYQWTCQEPTCLSPAEMKYDYTNKRWECKDDRCQQSNGMARTGSGWACTDSSCPIPMVLRNNQWVCLSQSNAVGTVFPWTVVLLLSAAVVYLGRQLKNKAQSNQLDSQYMRSNNY